MHQPDSIVIQTNSFGVTILAQDEIIGEKQSGTAEWLLSKPVARPAFLLAKLAAMLWQFERLEF